MTRRLQVLLLLGATTIPLFSSCLPLVAAGSQRIPTDGRSACVVVTVDGQQPSQILLEQPVDLAIHVQGPAGDIHLDSFEFGPETLTLILPGTYQLTIRAVQPAEHLPRTLSVSGRAVALSDAQRWRDAEVAATAAKQSPTTQNVAAAVTIWRNLNDPSAAGRTSLLGGDARLAADDLAGARQAYEAARQSCTGVDLRCLAEAANNSGYVASQTGDTEPAFRLLREAADLWRRLSLTGYEGRTLSNLGLLYWQSGDIDNAIAALRASLPLLAGVDRVGHAIAMHNLGECFQSVAEYDRSVAHFRSALQVFQESGPSLAPRATRTRMEIGRSYMLSGRYRLAATYLNRVLTESGEASDARAAALANLGQLALRQGDRALAGERFSAALPLHRQMQSKRWEALDQHYLGVVAGLGGDLDTATSLLREAVRLRREAGLREDASESLYALAEIEIRRGDHAAARNLLGEAIAAIETVRSGVSSAGLRASYYGRKRRFFDLLVESTMSGGDTVGGLQAAEQALGRSLLDLASRSGLEGAIPREFLNRRRELLNRLDLFSFRLAADPPRTANEAVRRGFDTARLANRQRVELLLGELDHLDIEIRRAADLAPVTRRVGSVAEVQAAVPASGAVLEYYLGERRSYLWLIERGRVRSFSLAPRAGIETLATRVGNEFGAILERRRSSPLQAAFENDLRQLSAMLLGPLRGIRLPDQLTLVLDGVLHRVPMAALRAPGEREPLGLAHALVQAPSSAFLVAGRQPASASTFRLAALALADPVFGPSDPRLAHPRTPTVASRPELSRLSFTADVDALRAVIPRGRLRLLEGFEASRDRLQREPLADFAVLHFSTHSFIDGRLPELSRVALSLVDRQGRPVDGYLHPHELAGFPLKGSVVVLSSCDTALGKQIPGEGLIGFTGSLFSAGASQLVLSLAQIDDESSSAFFAEAYRRYFGGDAVGIEHAIRDSRRVLARSNRWSDPFYWASFPVIGRPGAGQ